MRILHYSDTHCSDVAPISRTDTYTEDILDKMRQIYEIGKEAGVAYYIHTGDTFHIKAASRVSHWLVQRIFEIMDAGSAQTFLLPGGHDLSHGRLESLNKQPLGMVSKSKKIVLLDKAQRGEISWDKEIFSYVSVPGTPRFEESTSIETILALGDADLLIAHAPIAFPEEKFPFASINVVDLVGHFGLVLYGHIHGNKGVVRVGDTVISRPGAVARGALTEVNLSRIPQVALIDIKKEEGKVKVSYTLQELKVRPSGIAFRLDEARQKEAVKEEINVFLSKLKTAVLSSLDRQQIIEKIKLLQSISREVRDMAIGIMEDA